jgi:ABC-type nitrate/sulfonate/bicarbonate transport system permease component
MKSRRYLPAVWHWVRGFYPLLIVAVIWEAVARFKLIYPTFLPPLSDTLVQLWKLTLAGEIMGPLSISLCRAGSGFLLAMVIGVGLGFAMARSQIVRWLFRPLLAISFPAPKVAFLPIFILWFGIDHLSKIALVTFACVFPFVIAAQAGASAVPRVQIWAAEAMATRHLDMLWRVVLPASLPSLMSGVRVAVPYALVSAFTAEMIAGGGGLGGSLVYAQRYFETPTVFAILLVMLVAGYVIDYGVLQARAYLLRWAEPV